MRRILTVLALSLALLASCATAGTTSSGGVSVTGNGSVTLSPDMATFSVSVSETAETTAEAQAATNAKMAQIYATLSEEFGVEAKDLRTTSMNLYPDYEYVDGRQVLTGQTSSQSLNVTLHDLDDLAPVVDRLSTISGISLSSISLDAADKAAAQAEARALAVEDAMSKASDYATAAGLGLGKALAISEAGFTSYSNRIQPTMLYAEAASAGSAKDSASYYAGDLQVTAEVSVTFALD